MWDLEKTTPPGAAPEPGLEKRAGRSIPQLVFSHAGHRASVSCTREHVPHQHMEWGNCKLSKKNSHLSITIFLTRGMHVDVPACVGVEPCLL